MPEMTEKEGSAPTDINMLHSEASDNTSTGHTVKTAILTINEAVAQHGQPYGPGYQSNEQLRPQGSTLLT